MLVIRDGSMQQRLCKLKKAAKQLHRRVHDPGLKVQVWASIAGHQSVYVGAFAWESRALSL